MFYVPFILTWTLSICFSSWRLVWQRTYYSIFPSPHFAFPDVMVAQSSTPIPGWKDDVYAGITQHMPHFRWANSCRTSVLFNHRSTAWRGLHQRTDAYSDSSFHNRIFIVFLSGAVKGTLAVLTHTCCCHTNILFLFGGTNNEEKMWLQHQLWCW